MNKAQIIAAVAERTGVSKVNAKKSIDSFLDIASETLRTGDKITLSGFGSFAVCQKPARTGRDFRTGSPVEIPARTAVKFRPSIESKF